MQGVFVSYRRKDAAGYVHALHDRLAERFGANNVFIDLDSIRPGRDFVEAIEKALSSCTVLVALIGQRWAPDRLRDSGDFVRLELEMALQRGLPIIPVLVEGSGMPRPEDLPGPLGPLSRKQAFEISDVRFRTDTERLLDLIEQLSSGQVLPSNLGSLEAPSPVPVSRVAPLSGRFLHGLGLVGTFLAWSLAAFHFFMNAMMIFDPVVDEDFALGLLLLVSTGLLIAAMVMRLSRASQTWVALLLAALWLPLATLGYEVFGGGSFDWQMVIVFLVFFSLPFTLLAWRYRRMLAGRQAPPRS